MKSKIRVGLRASGELKELFSVKERTNGDLLIARRPPREIAHTDGTLMSFEEQYYSVHNSDEARLPGVTIIQRTRYGKGKHYRENAALVTTPGDHLLWPIFATNPGYIEPGNQLLSLRGRETEHIICDADLDWTSLFLTVFVARPSLETRLIFVEDAACSILRFERFILVLLQTFCPYMTMTRGATGIAPTSNPILNGHAIGVRRPEPGVSLPLYALGSSHVELVTSLRAEFKKKALEEMIRTLGPVDEVTIRGMTGLMSCVSGTPWTRERIQQLVPTVTLREPP